jgi:P4 family phage/plasmid primase-like protien
VSNPISKTSANKAPHLVPINKVNSNLGEIERTLQLLHPPDRDADFEIRALEVQGRGTVTGVYHTSEIVKAAKDAAWLSNKAKGVYVILNPVSRKCYERAPGRLVTAKMYGTTANHEIEKRTALLLDIDVERKPKNISTTNEEHKAAIARCGEIVEALQETYGLPEPTLGDSANGGHALWHTDLPNNDESKELVEGFLAALDRGFSTDKLKVDTSVSKAAQLTKLFGTMACKGPNTADRPHRRAKILKVPKVKRLVTRAMLQSVIDAYPPPKRPGKPTSGDSSKNNPITWADIEPYIRDRITKDKEAENGSTIYEIKGCPFGEDHPTDRAGYLNVYPDGSVVPGCHHDHCQGKTFLDFIKAVAPELLEKLKKTKLERLKEKYWRAPSFDGDGECLRVSEKQFAEIRGEIPSSLWYPATVEWLIKECFFENYFAREPSGFLYVWDHGCYRDTAEQRIRRLAKRVIPARLWTTKFVNETIALIAADAPLLWMRPPLDVLNLENGLLDLKTLELKPHTPDHLSMVQLPVRYDPAAKCPKWDEQVAETFPKDAVAAGVPEGIVGWFMRPDMSRQKAILLLGPGGTGKSTWLTWLGNFLGTNNISSVSLQMLEANRFASYQLIGKLANICADLPSEDLFSTSVFREITGKDGISVERKYHQPFTYFPFTRLIFSANDPPQSKDATDAFFDRWLVLEFTNIFRNTPREKDRSLLDAELTAPEELSGVLNKALKTLGRDLTVTASMKESHDAFREVTDPLSVWLAKRTITNPVAMIPPSELLEEYNHDAANDGRPLMNKTSFGKAMKRLRPNLPQGKRTYHGRLDVNVYIGIAIRVKGEEEEEI